MLLASRRKGRSDRRRARKWSFVLDALAIDTVSQIIPGSLEALIVQCPAPLPSRHCARLRRLYVVDTSLILRTRNFQFYSIPVNEPAAVR
jgi:hypothetical protein